MPTVFLRAIQSYSGRLTYRERAGSIGARDDHGTCRCYLLKAAAAWHELYQQTKERIFLEYYEDAFRGALWNGHSLLTGKTEQETLENLHDHLYFLEGTLPFADKEIVKKILSEGIEQVSGLLRLIAPGFERSDLYAQLLRVRLLGDRLAGIVIDQTKAAEEAEHILHFQFPHTDSRIDGGFWFGRQGSKLMPFVDPKATALCLQALSMWDGFLNGEKLDRTLLI